MVRGRRMETDNPSSPHSTNESLPRVDGPLDTGCNYHPPGPAKHFPTTHLEGKITIGGQPITKGWVTLFPIESALGQPVIVPIHSDGRYETDAAPVGPLAVRVTLPKSQSERVPPAVLSRRGSRCWEGFESPLRVKTIAEQANQFDVDLAFVPLKIDKPHQLCATLG